MIASLSGWIQEVLPDSLVVQVGGVGLQVFVPNHTRENLRSGESANLHTYLVVREDALTLYGFETREERDYFGLLLGVNGIGPKLSLAVLSVLSPDAIRRAVVHEQVDVFSRVPGVGKKTAQKILLQLQDRVLVAPGMEPILAISDVDTEVIGALTALGYSVVEAQTAVQSIGRDGPQDIETRLRLALQYFA
jgi:Holliday junction DNA helicase RuvA